MSKYNNIIKSFHEYLTPEDKVFLYSIYELKDDKYPIYFNHKLADHISTYTTIYLGAVIDNELVIPVIDNCDHITEVSRADMWDPPCTITPYKISSSDYNEYTSELKTKTSSRSTMLSSLKQPRSYDYIKKIKKPSSLKTVRSYN